MSQLDPETQEMIRSFVSEAIDSLDSNEPIVEYLREDDNSEHVNSIFRVFHTLKGLSGFFEMYVINRVTHEAETLLDVMRKQNQKQSEEIITTIYSTFDFLRELLQRVNETFTDTGAEEEAENMILIIKDALSKIQNPDLDEDSFNFDFDEPQAAEPPSGESQLSPEDMFMLETSDNQPEDAFASQLAEDTSAEDAFASQPAGDTSAEDAFVSQPAGDTSAEDAFVSQTAGDDEMNMESYVSNDLMDQYLVSASELLDTAENNLLILENEPHNFELIGNTFGAIHSLKGNSGFMGLSEIEEIAVEVESILDSVRNKELTIDSTIVSILLSNLEVIRNRISDLTKSGGASKPAEHHATPGKSYSPAPTAADIAVPEVQLNDDEDEIEDALPEHQTVQPEPKPTVAPKVAPQPKKAAADEQAKKTTPPPSMARKDIRVETSKVDKLFDLVGELITIETMVTKSPDLHGLELPNFLKSANMLNKITRELQEITMSVRMMPLESLFNKMKRLVRDVSIKMGKKVNLEISGQETEMDKNVIDEVADPLVHILRNAIDHGIELPSVRLANGKDEHGTVSLKARYEGNEILIIVKDDGAGIDRERVLQKAEEKGLLTTSPDKMSDKEVFQLIFEPGFSTSKEVTDISGRGVGMDVVKKNIEKLHGGVDVISKLGEGSTFTLRIPLTLAIMEAMLIRVGSARYALPLSAVTESFRVSQGMISRTMDGLEVCKLRDDVVPVLRLHELFGVKPDSQDLERGIVIIIESREKQIALFADEIVGQQQAVIKGLSDYIGKVRGITGCMILGDGGIGLIVDIESLVELSESGVLV